MIVQLVIAGAAAAQAPALPAFMTGCWEERGRDGKWAEECWTQPRGRLMIGSGRTGRGDTVRNWEWMRIEQSIDGTVTFYGSPNGAPAVGFKATQVESDSVTFLNASHDYPQRLRYVRTKDGIEAETSLADGSKPHRWSYRRSGSPVK